MYKIQILSGLDNVQVHSMGIDMTAFKNPNILQSDQKWQPRKVDNSESIQIRCPHCGSMGTFCSAVAYGTEGRKFVEGGVGYPTSAVMRICPNLECNGIVFTLACYASNDSSLICFPPERLSFDPKSIPKPLTRTLEEAISCHSQGAHRAAAMMVRRLLEELCEDCGAKGRTLHDRLKDLRSHITLSEELFDGMQQLKSLGNDAAHIEAKAFSSISEYEAELSIELAKEILKARYQHKDLVDRLKAMQLV